MYVTSLLGMRIMSNQITKIGTIIAILLACSHFMSMNAEDMKPNIVFIISDQHKYKSLGCNGDDLVITPNIDSLAKNGIYLSQCYTPAPVCALSRASYITGREPWANGAIHHKAPIVLKNGKEVRMGAGFLRRTGYHENITTMGEVFRSNGYMTAAPGKMHVHGELQKNVDPDHPKGNDLGFDETSLRYYTNFPGGHYADEVGMETYHRYRQMKKFKDVEGVDHMNSRYLATHVVKDEDNYDMVVTRKATEFIDRRGKDGKPFFLHVGLEKPHPPFTTAQRYLDMYKPEDFTLPKTHDDWHKNGKYPWSPDWVHSGWTKNDPMKAKNIMASYYACITQVDDMVGRVVKSLKKAGLYENTVIIYTTDHGEHLFEHGLRGKHNMYEASIKIPFIISYPKALPKNVRNDSLVSLIDLIPTFCAIMGWKSPESAMGVSFWDTIIQGKSDKSRQIYAEYRTGNYRAFPEEKDLPSRMQRWGDYKYIYTHGIIDQLYHITKDADELNNLVMNPEYKKILQKKRFETLAHWRFDKYRPIKVEVKGEKLVWNAHPTCEKYDVFYSANGQESQAAPLASGVSATSFEASKPGTYWVMGVPHYTRTTPRFKNTPVLVEEHSYILPISDAIIVL
jgi:arylsulfatase A-like enzyme